MTTETPYRRAAVHLLRQARQELALGDTRQASEKGWGAAAQAVKAVAEIRGWEHKSHYLLYEAVHRTACETGNEELDTFFHVAGNLHHNFYENWMPAGSVSVGLDDVAEFVAMMADVD